MQGFIQQLSVVLRLSRDDREPIMTTKIVAQPLILIRQALLFGTMLLLAEGISGCGPSVDIATIRDESTARGTIALLRESDLVACVGLTADQVRERLRLAKDSPETINEPPGQLRGLSYELPEGQSLIIFLDQDDATVLAQNKAASWDAERLGTVKVIGLRYQHRKEVLSAGDIPVSFRVHDAVQEKRLGDSSRN
jgi:hypothetical protein